MNILISLVKIVLFFSCSTKIIVQALQSQDSFVNPLNNSNITYNSVVSVEINFVPQSSYVNVTQLCLSSISQIINNGGTNPSTGVFALPNNYIGTCTYSGVDDFGNDLIPVAVNVQGAVSFNLPADSSSISAGSSAILKLAISPITAPVTVFAVQLICPNLAPSSAINISSTLTTSFAVPSNFYGSVCTFQAIGLNYNLAYVNVKITQPLTFSSPASFSTVIQPNNLNITMLTGGLTVPENVFLNLQFEMVTPFQIFQYKLYLPIYIVIQVQFSVLASYASFLHQITLFFPISLIYI